MFTCSSMIHIYVASSTIIMELPGLEREVCVCVGAVFPYGLRWTASLCVCAHEWVSIHACVSLIWAICVTSVLMGSFEEPRYAVHGNGEIKASTLQRIWLFYEDSTLWNTSFAVSILFTPLGALTTQKCTQLEKALSKKSCAQPIQSPGSVNSGIGSFFCDWVS